MEFSSLDPIRLDLSGRILIEASAGTGKTHTITSLFLRLVLEKGMDTDGVLCVTFTRAAARELREKIRRRIMVAIEMLKGSGTGRVGEDRFLSHLLQVLSAKGRDTARIERCLKAALFSMDQASIFTIHGFCQRMLSEFAFETGMPFGFELDISRDETIRLGLERFFRTRLSSLTPDVLECIRRLVSPHAGKGLMESVQGLLSALQSVPDAMFPRVCPFREVLVSKRRLDESIDALYFRWQRDGDSLCKDIEEDLSVRADGLAAFLEKKGIFTSKAMGHLKTYFKKRIKQWIAKDRKKIEGFLWNRSYVSGACSGLKDVELLFDMEPYSLFSRIYQSLLDLKTCNEEKKRKRRQFESILGQWAETCPSPDGMRHDLISKVLSLRAKALEFDETLFYAFLYTLNRDVQEYCSIYRQERRLLSYDDMLRLLRDALKGPVGTRLNGLIGQRYNAVMIDEFQDTDPVQWEIFSTLFPVDSAVPLILIGDPKQAIYSFRGGDIFTYLKARRTVDEGKRYYLDTNWRSVSGYVRALNGLFRQGRASPFFMEELSYMEVKPRKEDNSWLVVKGGEGLGRGENSLFFLAAEGDRERLPYCRAVSRQIKALLVLSGEKRAWIEDLQGKRGIEPADIAILVRDFVEAGKIQRALRDHGIQSIFQSRSSVFESKEARELLLVLRAVSNPRDVKGVMTGLSTVMLGWDAPAIHRCLNDDVRWNEVSGLFEDLRSMWLSKGVLACFFKMLKSFDIPARLLSLPDGERRLTNLRQLSEALSVRETEHQSRMDALLSWFREKTDSGTAGSEDDMLRLETDENSVKVFTYHRSKGLEFPVLFLPFLGGITGRREEFLKKVYSFDDEAYVMFQSDLTRDVHLERQWELQNRSEAARLIYVALTRAKYRCYVGFEGLKHPWDSLFLEMAGVDTKAMEGEDILLPMLQKLSEEVSGSEVIATCLDGLDPLLSGKEQPAVYAGEAAVLKPSRRPVAPQVFTVSSFSGLSRHDHQDGVLSLEYGAEKHSLERRDIFSFPRGPAMGSFLHEVLEKIDFKGERDDFSPVIRQCMERWSVDSAWMDVVAEMLQNVLCAQIHPGLRLRDIGENCERREMDFRWSFNGDEDFRKVVKRLFPDVRQGIITGFIDLFFEWNGRLFVADYKSNWLGDLIEDYRAESLKREMESNGYFLQAGIYARAVSLFARRLLPGYSFRDRFGGVFFLFLRGIRKESGERTGVYYISPDELSERMAWVRS